MLEQAGPEQQADRQNKQMLDNLLWLREGKHNQVAEPPKLGIQGADRPVVLELKELHVEVGTSRLQLMVNAGDGDGGDFLRDLCILLFHDLSVHDQQVLLHQRHQSAVHYHHHTFLEQLYCLAQNTRMQCQQQSECWIHTQADPQLFLAVAQHIQWLRVHDAGSMEA